MSDEEIISGLRDRLRFYKPESSMAYLLREAIRRLEDK